MSGFSIIPLAITVMLGPQILVAILLITRKDPVKSSLAYIFAIVTTTVLTTLMYYFIITLTGLHKASGSDGPILKYILAAILFLLIVRTYIHRKKMTKTPKWITDLAKATTGKIILIGFLLILIMPGDIVSTLTVAGLIKSNNASFLFALPFFAAVALIVSLPLVIYLIAGKKGQLFIDKADKWIDTHGYLLNIIVFSVFIVLLLS
jgi:hypothetical protein